MCLLQVDRKKAGTKLKKLAAIFFLLLWIASAIVLTFHGPFTVTGNGYFATWASLGCAFLFVFQECECAAAESHGANLSPDRKYSPHCCHLTHVRTLCMCLCVSHAQLLAAIRG